MKIDRVSHLRQLPRPEQKDPSFGFGQMLRAAAHDLDRQEQRLSPKSFRSAATPQKLLEMQAEVYDYTRKINVTSKLTQLLIDGTKQIVRSQS